MRRRDTNHLPTYLSTYGTKAEAYALASSAHVIGWQVVTW